MPSLWIVAAVGLGVGTMYGLLGVGGAVLGTPVLALVGVPALMAVASPLPGTLPAAFVAALSYARRDEVDRAALVPAAIVATPAAIGGALFSSILGGRALLTLSGLFLGFLGLLLLRPAAAASAERLHSERRRLRVVASVAVAAFGSGLLANGGAALLIPLLVVFVGMQYRTAVGTSLVIVPLVALPAVVTHAALGHVDWSVAAAFAAGVVPSAGVGARLAARFSHQTLQKLLGWLLVAFAAAFTAREILT